MPSELEKSYELIGRIFEKLIKSGLRVIDLDATQFTPEGTEPTREDNEHFLNVMSFLRAERLVRSTDVSTAIGEEGGTYYAAQLTASGLHAIESKRFGEGQSVRSKIEEGGLSSESYGKVGSFIGGFVGSKHHPMQDPRHLQDTAPIQPLMPGLMHPLMPPSKSDLMQGSMPGLMWTRGPQAREVYLR